VVVIQPVLQQTSYEYDQNGNLVSVTNAKGKKTTLAYEERDLLISRTDPLGSVTGYAYDGLGRLVQVTDAEGNSMQNRYDALSRLVEVIDAMNGHTTYEYDALGNLTAFTDANMHRTSFDVDLLGRTTGEHNPLGSAWQYQFDAAGNLIQRTDAKGVVTQYTYDADNRLAHTAYPSGPAVDMGYDANDNLVNVTDGSGAAAFAYDALNRLTRIQRTAGILATKTLQYSYDAAGNRTGVTYPGGQAVSYAFNANNWLVTATDPIAGATQYTYDPVGLPILEQNPNGTKTEYAYDDADRLVKLFNLKPQTSTDVISSFEYTLDRVGNRVQTIEKATSGQLITWTENYAYDKLYRLTKAVELPNYKSAQPYTSEFVYDAVGNRLSLSTNIQDKPNTPPLAKPVITNYTYNAANQMLTAGNTTFSYDANGNRVTMAGPTTAIDYVYDFENRLAGAQTFNILKGKRQKDSVLDFIYDGLGRRLERGIVESGVRKTADFLYDGLGYDLLAQYVQPNNPNETLYFRDQTRMLSRYEIGGANHWYGYAHDGLDSVSGWSNINGASVQEYKYAPYGRLIDNNGPDNTSNQTSPPEHGHVQWQGVGQGDGHILLRRS
jgi:YD repeat-containing protein